MGGCRIGRLSSGGKRRCLSVARVKLCFENWVAFDESHLNTVCCHWKQRCNTLIACIGLDHEWKKWYLFGWLILDIRHYPSYRLMEFYTVISWIVKYIHTLVGKCFVVFFDPPAWILHCNIISRRLGISKRNANQVQWTNNWIFFCWRFDYQVMKEHPRKHQTRIIKRCFILMDETWPWAFTRYNNNVMMFSLNWVVKTLKLSMTKGNKVHNLRKQSPQWLAGFISNDPY